LQDQKQKGETIMKNQKTDYLAARLGIVSNTNKVPYGWEIPEDETTSETRASTDTFSRFGLISIVVLAMVLGFGFIHNTLNLI
jgi:nitrate reductase NapE component